MYGVAPSGSAGCWHSMVVSGGDGVSPLFFSTARGKGSDSSDTGLYNGYVRVQVL